MDCGGGTQAFGVFILGDAWSFSELTLKIQPLGSILNFDADVKNTTARHQCTSKPLLVERRAGLRAALIIQLPRVPAANPP